MARTRSGASNMAGGGELHALPGEPRLEEPTFKRSNAWAATAAEVQAVRTAVGINEVQNFGKYRVSGPARAIGWTE